jgi:4-hydroxy-tetrahydrodipicolinate reductase
VTGAGTGPVRVSLFGATGRMGQSLVRAIHDSTDFELAGAAASPGSAALGADAATLAGLPEPLGVAVTGEARTALAGADVALDFSAAAAIGAHLEACLATGVAFVVGTTGFDAATDRRLVAASKEIAVLIAPNTSLGVNLLAQLVEKAAASLPPEYDIEILEAHHRYKVDAPSGTALKLGRAAAAGRRIELGDAPAAIRSGDSGPRQAGSIGFAVIRGGDIVGEHTVIYAGPGERIELTHRAHDRMTFAYGALRAAAWLRGRPAGLYTMGDVLGLR